MTMTILDHLSTLRDETRTRLLSLLEGGEYTVSELCSSLQAPQPTVSRHLKTLAEDGWVVSRSEGRNRHYRLSSALAPSALELWKVVREGLDTQVYDDDAERARQVLLDRRRRSAEFFSTSADRWDHLRRELFGDRADLLPLFGLLDPQWTVADLGAGTGGLAAVLAPFVFRLIGVDRSDAMLEEAARRLEGVDNVELRVGELEALPIADAEIDLAVLSLVLHYTVDPREALEEAWRVLKPGGWLLVVELRAHDRGPEYGEAMGHVWPGFDDSRLAGWMKRAGFDSVCTEPLPPDPQARGPLLFLARGTRPRI
jgi:ubiquinone/menaquinone biosynthesis C-methylase UbiE/DNA-binding MarR family transcriptional regulator